MAEKWTPTDELVEQGARIIHERTHSITAEGCKSISRAVLTASPMGDLVEALEDLVDEIESNFHRNGLGAISHKVMGEYAKIGRAALAAANPESKTS